MGWLQQFIERTILSVTPSAARAGGGSYNITYPALANAPACSAAVSAAYTLGVMKNLLATAPTDLWLEAIQVSNVTQVGEWLVAISQEMFNTATPQVPTPAALEVCIPVFMGVANTARLIEVRPPVLIHIGKEINASVAIGATAAGPKIMEVKVICSVAK